MQELQRLALVLEPEKMALVLEPGKKAWELGPEMTVEVVQRRRM